MKTCHLELTKNNILNYQVSQLSHSGSQDLKVMGKRAGKFSWREAE